MQSRMAESDQKILTKVSELQNEVLARKNEIKEGLKAPINWLDQSSDTSKLQRLDVVDNLLLQIVATFSASVEHNPDGLVTEVLRIDHDSFDNCV